jgi:hypothetical protein
VNAHGDIRDEWASRLRSLFAAELAGRPAYILDNFDVPAGLRVPTPAMAYTSPALDLRYQPAMQARGLWRGRGVVIFISDWNSFNAALTGRQQWGAILHEVSHHFDTVQHWHAAPEGMAALAAADPALMAEITAELANRKLPPWDQHETSFIRAALHAQHRATLAGWGVGLEDLFVAGPHYGLSPVHAYHARLTDELRSRATEPITSILATPPPVAFADLFAEDVAQVHAEHSEAADAKPDASGCDP